MGKALSDAILDAQLAAADGTNIHVCSAEPANYAGIAAVELATQAIVGSHTKADGDVSGRKNTTPAQSDITIDTSGTATHVVESNGADTIKRVTTCTSQALTSGGTVDVPTYDHEIGDPS